MNTNAQNYFTGCRTVEAVKALYRELARANHPDLGGDTATMQAINAEYLRRLEGLDGQESHDSRGNVHTYHYNEAREQDIADKIAEVLANLKGDANLWLIGLWIWIFDTEKGDGNAEPLKAAGFRWNRRRTAWTWKPYSGKTRPSREGIAGIAAQYGARRFEREEREQYAALT